MGKESSSSRVQMSIAKQFYESIKGQEALVNTRWRQRKEFNESTNEHCKAVLREHRGEVHMWREAHRLREAFGWREAHRWREAILIGCKGLQGFLEDLMWQTHFYEGDKGTACKKRF